MKATRLASLTALVALAGACHTAVPTEPATEVVAKPAFDGGMYGSGNVAPDAGGNGVGSGDFVANGEGSSVEPTSSDSTTTGSPGGERGGNGFGSGN